MFGKLKTLRKTTLAWNVLVFVAIVVLGVLVFRNTRSNKSPQTTTHTEAASTTQQQSSPNTTASGPGTNTNPTPVRTEAPSYTKSLATSFHVNNDAQDLGKGVITYSISDDKGNVYSVVQQPTPASFDQKKFAQGLKNTEAFTAPLGSVVIGESGSELLASVSTADNRWILIQAPLTSLRAQIETITKSIQPK